MKFESTNPDITEWSPFYSDPVSPRQCYFYLSFLEKFVELTKDMTFDELRMFMVCAEYRYFKFAHQGGYPYGIHYSVPSIDVAFFIQVYLIYLAQDNQNGGRLKHYPSQTQLHLEQICKEACLIDGDLSRKKQMGDNLPYHFTKENFKQAFDTSFAEIICIVCFALNKVDCALKEYAEITQLLSTDKAVQRLPFNSGLEGIQSFLLEKLNEKEHTINGFLDKIKSTYFCSPYPATSVDLIRAVADFYAFAFKVTQTIDWNLPDDYWICVLQYHHFVNLVFETETPDMTPIPNIRIDLARHLHMLNPAHYSTYRLWNCVINIPRNEAKAKQLAEITNCEWKLYFAKREQNAAVTSLNKGIKKTSWRVGMFKEVLRPGKYLDYAMEETSISYEDGHKRFAHFNQLISHMTENRSIKHITDDAIYSRVYQPANAKDSERVNITKSPDFDWLVPNTSWTNSLKPYREYPQHRHKILGDLGTIGGCFAKENMPSDTYKKLTYCHPWHHPPMTFEYYYSSDGGGGAC